MGASTYIGFTVPGEWQSAKTAGQQVLTYKRTKYFVPYFCPHALPHNMSDGFGPAEVAQFLEFVTVQNYLNYVLLSLLVYDAGTLKANSTDPTLK